MNVSNSKINGKQALKGNWGLSISAVVLYTVMVSSFVLLVTPLFSDVMEAWLDLVWATLFTPVLGAGVRWLHLGMVDGEKKSVSSLFDAFKLYGQMVAMNFLKGIIATLWAIVPTIIAAGVFVSSLENASSIGGAMATITLYLAIPTIVVLVVLLKYSQAVYLFRDNPEMGVREALRASKELMQRSKVDYFTLNLGYALWYLPAVVLLYVAWYQSAISALPIMWGGNPGAAVTAERIFMLASVYGLGISFYVVPQWHAAMAAFHRILVPLEVEEHEGDPFNDNSWTG